VLAQLKAPYSIPNPGVLFNAGGEYENYYTAYINEVWATNPLSGVPMPGENASGLGAILGFRLQSTGMSRVLGRSTLRGR